MIGLPVSVRGQGNIVFPSRRVEFAEAITSIGGIEGEESRLDAAAPALRIEDGERIHKLNTGSKTGRRGESHKEKHGCRPAVPVTDAL